MSIIVLKNKQNAVKQGIGGEKRRSIPYQLTKNIKGDKK